MSTPPNTQADSETNGQPNSQANSQPDGRPADRPDVPHRARVADGPRPELARAAVVTLVFVVATLVVFALLSWLTNRAGPDRDEDFVGTLAFRTWTGIAAISVVTFCDAFLAGVHALAGHPEPPEVPGGLRARLTAWRPELKRDLAAAWFASWRYGAFYLAFAGVAVVVLMRAGKGGPDVPVEDWAPIARSLLALGAVAACPWVVLVWTVHDQMTRTRKHIETLPSFSVGPVAPGAAAATLDDQLRVLLADRRTISTAVTRLTILVLAAMLLSGALRTALHTWHPDSDDLPASAVLLYGAFFAAALGLAVIPLLRAWRNTAMLFVDHVFPPSVATTADADSARTRLVTRLDLNSSLFRSPIALSSVLAPVVTSLLAVFIPKVG